MRGQRRVVDKPPVTIALVRPDWAGAAQAPPPTLLTWQLASPSSGACASVPVSPSHYVPRRDSVPGS